MSRGRACALLLVLALVASGARAAELTHALAEGERVEDVALRYFGNALAAEALRYYNGLAEDEPRAGTVLRVPAPDEITAAEADSWRSLAEQHWGDAKLGPELALLNTGEREAPVVPGGPVRVPMLLQYRIQSGNTLLGVARRFLGSRRQVELIQRFNPTVRPQRLLVGQKIRVPLLRFGDPLEAEVTPPSLPSDVSAALVETPERGLEPTGGPAVERAGSADAEASSPPDDAGDSLPARPLASVSSAPREPSPDPDPFSAPLRTAVNKYLEGQFAESREQLEGLRAEVLARGSADDRELLLRHLIYVYVAFGDPERACESYRALEAIQPSPEWNPDLVSPKILRVVEACGGG